MSNQRAICNQTGPLMRKVIFVLSSLCVGLLLILGFKIWQRLQVEVLQIGPPKLEFRAARQTFPFSVIPGGLLDAQELTDSISKDVVVREHYRGLQPDRMWFTRVQKPMMAYVSFRKGSNIGWTTHPVAIPANELVLTDGKSMIRARCGNRIEIKRPQPLPASVQPPEVPPPDIALDTGLPWLVPPTITPPAPPSSQVGKAGEPTVARTSTPPTTWCCGIVNKVLPSVPEPGSFILVCTGGLGLIALIKRRMP
jgi:hypothetical protein